MSDLMKKWELARYLLDAKKSIDTLLYVAENSEDISMIDIQELVNEIRRKFYVDACVVLDKCYPKKKKEICKDNVIESVYYERDKNYAHKDTDYKRKQYGSILEMAGEMKRQLAAVQERCSSYLPEELTLDYLIFDAKLYRMVNGITKEKEEQALNIKHPGRKRTGREKGTEKGEIYTIFRDTEQIRDIPENERMKYATVFQTGIVIEETFQKMQDSCIRTNVLYGTNIWVSINQTELEKIVKMRKLGVLDEMDVPAVVPRNKREEQKLTELLRKEGVL